MMKVIQAEALGMCFGVRDALAIMRNVATPTQVTVFGELVHNPHVTDEIQRRGFDTLQEQSRDDQPLRETVLITAHGVSNRQREELQQSGKQIIDTTCPLVRKAHRAALALAAAGFFVIVIGKKGHVEVRGLTGDLPAEQYAIVETQMGVRKYDAQRIAVMCQTTTVQREAQAILARVRELNAGSEVRFVNTICQPTRDRQTALERLLEQVNVMVVVGGHHSNNTRQLVSRAREAGIRAVHVEDAGELKEEMFSAGEVVGLTAGTSTLPETVEAVHQKLIRFHQRLLAPAREENMTV